MKNLSLLRKNFNLTQKDLANTLKIEEKTIANYENKNTIPPLLTLIKFSNFFKLTIDYIIKDELCIYPKNLKLLYLAKKLDEFAKAEARNTIEYSAKSFLKEKINEELLVNFDENNLSIKLTNNFNSNLKKIRIIKKITQKDLSEKIGVSRALLAKYEEKTFPPVDKMIKLSDILNISIHALATGEKLFFDFTDGHFGKTILFADQFLSLDDQQILIRLMENIVNEKIK